MQHRPAVVVDDLRAAAADLQNDPLGDVHGVDDAAVDERRLLLLAENFHFDAAGRLDLVQEAALVFGAAHRRRRHRDDAVHAAGIRQLLKHLQGTDGLCHARRFEEPVALHVLPEADALFQLVHHHKMPFAKQFDDHEPRRIGTEVNDTDLLHYATSAV